MEKKFETNGINFLFKIKESILFLFFQVPNQAQEVSASQIAATKRKD